jgi:predicted lipoprotein with Yx(FWY)xxD motif
MTTIFRRRSTAAHARTAAVAGGRTLYLVEADKGTASTCDGACASAWPPLTTADQPYADAGVSASKLGPTKRGDGTTEVTYNAPDRDRLALD